MGRRARVTSGVGGLLLVVALAMAGASLPVTADAAVRAKADRSNELRFKLDGRDLTLTIFDRPRFRQTPTIESYLLGKRLWVGCGTSFRAVNRRGTVGRVIRWPRDVTSTKVRLARDISRHAKWCLVEATGRFAGGDILFVSFVEPEPGRRLASGLLRDGARWRVVAWRGSKLEPCLQFRLPQSGGTFCFDAAAEIEPGVEASLHAVTCTGEAMVLGAVDRSTARVEIRMADGAVVPATVHARPRGSRVRAAYFTALVTGQVGRPVEIASVVAYDAEGKRIASDRHVSGTHIEPCGLPDR